MKTIKHITRSNLPKPKTFKLRNYRPAEEVIAEQIKQNEKNIKKPQKINTTKPLERQPEKDLFDYTYEEEGFFMSNGNKINIKFPR